MGRSGNRRGRALLSVLLILPAGAAQEASRPAAAVELAQVEAAEAPLFSMEAETADVTLPGRLPKGALVLVLGKGESFAGEGTHFYKVGLPGGLEGFVHAGLVRVLEAEPGWGVTARPRSTLRVQASSQQFPLSVLEQGVRIRLLGRQGEWWRVLAPEEIHAYMREGDLKLMGPASAHADLVARARGERLAEWERQIAEQARGEALARKRAAVQEYLVALKGRLAAEGQRGKEADIDALRRELAEVEKAFSAEDLKVAGLDGEVAYLGHEVQRLQDLRDAILAKEKADAELARMAEKPPEPPPVKEDFWKEGFVGHLKKVKQSYLTELALVKGEKVICFLRSSTGRYALADFQGCYLLVKGEVSTPPSLEGEKLVEVTRLEIQAVSQ